VRRRPVALHFSVQPDIHSGLLPTAVHRTDPLPWDRVTAFTESVVEDATLAWLESLGYTILHGPDIAVGEPAAERTDPNYRDVILESRLRQSLARLNPDLPPEVLDDACRNQARERTSCRKTR